MGLFGPSPPRANCCGSAATPAPGTALDRITAYLRWTKPWPGCERLAEALAEGRQHGELPAALDPPAAAATVVAVLQGGYVPARAADSVQPFD